MAEGQNLQTASRYSKGPSAATMPEMLGRWATVPGVSPAGVAFDATATTMGEATIWRDDLPGDARQAYADLDQREAKLQASERALVVVAERLNRFAAVQTTGLAFDTAAAEAMLAPPEQDLLAALSQVREGRPSTSYGLGHALSGGWEQATQQFQEMVEQLHRFVAHYAWVETRVQDQLLGRTTVSWTGDVDTIWWAELASEQVQLHQRTLALALHSRDTLMRTFVLATAFAIKLSALLSTPGGVILALPLAWKFIQQVLAEVSQ